MPFAVLAHFQMGMCVCLCGCVWIGKSKSSAPLTIWMCNKTQKQPWKKHGAQRASGRRQMARIGRAHASTPYAKHSRSIRTPSLLAPLLFLQLKTNLWSAEHIKCAQPPPHLSSSKRSRQKENDLPFASPHSLHSTWWRSVRAFVYVRARVGKGSLDPYRYPLQMRSRMQNAANARAGRAYTIWHTPDPDDPYTRTYAFRYGDRCMRTPSYADPGPSPSVTGWATLNRTNINVLEQIGTFAWG